MTDVRWQFQLRGSSALSAIVDGARSTGTGDATGGTGATSGGSCETTAVAGNGLGTAIDHVSANCERNLQAPSLSIAVGRLGDNAAKPHGLSHTSHPNSRHVNVGKHLGKDHDHAGGGGAGTPSAGGNGKGAGGSRSQQRNG